MNFAVVLMLRFLVVIAESNITDQTMTRKFGDQISDTQSETVIREHQERRGSFDAQMTSVQFQVNSSQMRRQMQNPMQMQYQMNTGPLQFRNQGNFENSQMRNQWNPMQRQYQRNPDTMPFKSQRDFENRQVRNQMNSMQWQYQISPGSMQFRSQDDSENPQVRGQMNSMLSQYQMNPNPIQFRNQDDSDNPQMNGQMNSRQWQYQMNPDPMQFQSQDDSENPRVRYQMNSRQRQYQTNTYRQGPQNAPTMHNLSEIIERDFLNQNRDQIEAQRSEEYLQMRSHMNPNYQQEHYRQSTSLKRGQRNIYKVYLREENTKSNERETTTMPSNSYTKPLFRAVTAIIVQLTGTRSKKSTQWEEWIPPHLIEDEYYPDSFITKPWGTGKTKSDGKDQTKSDGKDITDSDGNVITKSDDKYITDSDGKYITDSDGNVITKSDGKGKDTTNSAQNVSWEGDFMDGYHPNEERFDFTATIPKNNLMPKRVTLSLLELMGKTKVPSRPSFTNACDDIIHWCMRAYVTASICARTVFFTYQTFPNYCTMEFINCRHQLEVWNLLHMGECYEAKPISSGFYSHYAYKDESWLDQYMVVKDAI